MGTHHARGVRPGTRPYSARGTGGMAAGAAANRCFLASDGRSASGLVAASHHRPPRFRCHAQRRSASAAARAAGLSPHPAVPDEPRKWAPNHHGGRDDLGAPRSTCGETPPQSSPTSTACSDGPGVRVGSLPGRACSTIRSSDGRVGLAPIDSGGEPWPKLVRCNRKTAAIRVVRDRLR